MSCRPANRLASSLDCGTEVLARLPCLSLMALRCPPLYSQVAGLRLPFDSTPTTMRIGPFSLYCGRPFAEPFTGSGDASLEFQPPNVLSLVCTLPPPW